MMDLVVSCDHSFVVALEAVAILSGQLVIYEDFDYEPEGVFKVEIVVLRIDVDRNGLNHRPARSCALMKAAERLRKRLMRKVSC